MKTLTAALLASAAMGICAQASAQGVSQGAGPAAGAAPAPAEQPRPRPGAPNVLIWMLDDVGFGQLSAFGGLVETPSIERAAKMGLIYGDYHTTPICSASRAAMLTGRNPHTVHIGAHAAAPSDHPAHEGHIPASAGTLAANLKAAGYRTYALGKWDHLPSSDTSAKGPFTYWPSGQGFDHFYGFLAADADQFRPILWEDHTPIEAPHRPEYHLSADLADHAIRWLADDDGKAQHRPFMIYFATGAMHAPHQAPDSYLAKYRGRFDAGWDVARGEILQRQKALGLIAADVPLPPGPDGMPAWDSLTPEARQMYARAMEAFAAQLTHADAQFGRVLDALQARGELDNTIVVITTDNGASAEGAFDGTYNETLYTQGRYPTLAENIRHKDDWGTARAYAHYPLGWAVAGNTPFRYYKQTTYEGGVHVPLVVAWPKTIKDAGGMRRQFVDVIDITPTVLEAAGVAPAAEVNGVAQQPFEGVSFAQSFTVPKADQPGRRQYVEMWGDRAIYQDGWKAVAAERVTPWKQGGEAPIREDSWELYDRSKDPNELHNLAASDPARLARMKAMFDEEAKLRHVYPLIAQSDSRVFRQAQMAKTFQEHGGVWRYEAPESRIPEFLMPPLLMRDFRMSAKLQTPARAQGVVFSAGGRFGGVSLYFREGRPVFAYRNSDFRLTTIEAAKPLGAGDLDLGLEMRRTESGAHVRILDGLREIASGDVPGPISRNFSLTETFNVGSDSGYSPVADYETPNPFSGRLKEVVFDFNIKPDAARAGGS